jgi:tRNA1(Val) A37 N6-methylase TrmN6
MTKFNPPWNYAQPEFYRFSEDSVELAKQTALFVDANFSSNIENRFKIIDVGCGCGIVGLEFLKNLCYKKIPKVFSVNFLDINSLYREFLWKNICATIQFSQRLPVFSMVFNCENLLNYSSESGFDIVLMNPPYFHGQRSPDFNRALARSTTLDNFCRLIDAGLALLNKGGIFCFCHNDEQVVQKVLLSKRDILEINIIKSSKSGVGFYFLRHLHKE